MENDLEFIKELQKDFLDETTFQLEQCEESYLRLDREDCRVEELKKIFRLAHSIKGGGSAVGFADLSAFAHKVEDCLSVLRSNPSLVNSEVISLLLRAGDAFKERLRMIKEDSKEAWNIDSLTEEILITTTRLQNSAPAPEATIASPANQDKPTAATSFNSSANEGAIKINPNRIDSVLNLVGELVVLKSQIFEEFSVDKNSSKQNSILGLLDKVVRELQDKTLTMRMTALKPLFLKVQRIVRDLSLSLSKPVELIIEGEDIEIDRTMIELLADPLVHIARNAVDHGIEDHLSRKSSGKNEKARIELSARQIGGRIIIEVKDDGRGINREKVLHKAIEKGILPPGDHHTMTDSEVYALLFAPGFSTSETVTDISGRGVGLDVAKANIEKLCGHIEIKSTSGRGSCFCISLPLTTAITDGIVVTVAKNRFVVPITSIREIFRKSTSKVITLSQNSEVLKVRDHVLPIINARSLLEDDENNTETLNTEVLLVLEQGGIKMVLQADNVLGQNQVVVKPLGLEQTRQRNCEMVAGAAVLGDGKVALVLDIDGVIRKFKDQSINNVA